VEKKLTKTEYERLSREACEEFRPSTNDDDIEAALWRSVYMKVCCFLEKEPFLQPVTGATDVYMYRWNVQQLVHAASAGNFDTQAIPGECITAILRQHGRTPEGFKS